MALWWLYGGYVFYVGVKPQIFNFKLKIWPWGSRSSPTPQPHPHPHQTIRILTNVFCTSGPNLVILAWMDDGLRCRQAQNGVDLEFRSKFDLECLGRSLYKTIRTLTKLCCTFGRTSYRADKQVIDTNSHTQTKATTKAMVKTEICNAYSHFLHDKLSLYSVVTSLLNRLL